MDYIRSIKPTIYLKVKKWRTTIRQQERDLDRQIRGIENEELKVKQTLKQAAKRGDNATLRMLGKEIVRARKAREKMVKK